MNNMDKRREGSVTVYLMLVFAVILMLIVCVLSLMRYQAEKVNIKRDLDISVESAFGKYFRPLFDDYRMFYYIESDEEALSADIMSYFYENQKEMPKLLSLTPEEIKVSGKCYAPGNDKENFISQMCDAVIFKYGENAADSVIGKIKDRLDIISKDDDVLSDASEEVCDIEDDADFQKDVLTLLELVEGVRISDGGIKCADTYVKQAVKGKATMLNTGIDSEIIWNAVCEHYWSIDDMLKKLLRLAKKGVDGKSVALPQKELKIWEKNLCDIKKVTEKACALAKELDGRMAEGGKKKCICNVSAIYSNLAENISILDELISCAKRTAPKSISDWKEYKEYIGSCENMLLGYHVKSLYFDYSTLSLKKENNPVENVNPKNTGILELLTGDVYISSNAVTEADIYLKAKVHEEKTDIYDYREPEELADFLDSCKSEKKAENISDRILSALYINEYLMGFTDYVDKDSGKRALMYEKEYIIAANEADKDNLDEVAKKLLLMRTGMSFVYLISDRQKSNMAYATAAAIVGFTGMEALVKCTQYMILAGWAYEDACIDVCALLSGKKIPLKKNDNSLNVKYSELPMFGKQFIKEKAESISGNKGIDYSELMLIYICLMDEKKSVSRCMDIIQYNMKLNHSERFSFMNALYGAKAVIRCSRPYNMQAEEEYMYR